MWPSGELFSSSTSFRFAPSRIQQALRQTCVARPSPKARPFESTLAQ
jgi:hypothetical protein